MVNAAKTCFLTAVLAAVPASSGPAQAKAGDPKVAELAKEVATRGWILFAAHPAEVEGRKAIGAKQNTIIGTRTKLKISSLTAR